MTLGAPFEFRPAGTYRRRFPEPVLGGIGEMVGGGGWEPGEFTDDTARWPPPEACWPGAWAGNGASAFWIHRLGMALDPLDDPGGVLRRRHGRDRTQVRMPPAR